MMDPDADVVDADVEMDPDATSIVVVPPDKGMGRRNTDTEEETGVSKVRKPKERPPLRKPPLKVKLKPPLLKLPPLRSP